MKIFGMGGFELIILIIIIVIVVRIIKKRNNPNNVNPSNTNYTNYGIKDSIDTSSYKQMVTKQKNDDDYKSV